MKTIENSPKLWRAKFPRPAAEGHKYDRGHAIIAGGEYACTGAAKLAARAALRVGAGLVSIACDARTLPLYASSLMAVMTKPVETVAEFTSLIGDVRVKSVLVGPGNGLGCRTREYAMAALLADKPTVLDADALTVFAGQADALFALIKAPSILTPHEGEFARLFGPVGEDRSSAAAQAAQRSGAVVVLKGHDTVIAAPDGRVVVNRAASPFLATAGTGDVLAGIAAGLLAQGMPVFEAACCAVWLHAEAAKRFGAGLTAEDIEGALPPILQSLC